MNNQTSSTSPSAIRHSQIVPAFGTAASACCTAPRAGGRYADPFDYAQHPYDSMRRFAELLALRYDQVRTRHAYYRALRLLHEHCQGDPAQITEEQLRGYFLHVKVRKLWKPKTIRQAAAAARLFFVEMLERGEWKVFSQIRTKDHDELPAVLTRAEVWRLLQHIRLRRYRIPVKLIYCAGLRLSECLSLTIHDIKGDEGKLWVRGGKGGQRLIRSPPHGSLTPALRCGAAPASQSVSRLASGARLHDPAGADDGGGSAALLAVSQAPAAAVSQRGTRRP